MDEKWFISIIAEDEGWRESQGSIAVLNVETKEGWNPLKPEYKMKQFFPTTFHEILISDKRGNTFRFCPKRGRMK